jgi:hypothetical protein
MATLTKWVAGLSNGETVIENHGRFIEKDGGKSSWQQLQQYLVDNKLDITSIKIRVYEKIGLKTVVRDFNLPSNKSKFASEQPLDFDCSVLVRKIFNASMQEIPDLEEVYIVGTAYYSFGNVKMIVSKKDPNQSWISVNLSK